ncbi:hypothetical protein CRE_28119 [Caenorhabditis remanei]|uniref:C2H2-type domain-containing protein n=1 Tax=Caenorhabditis remanei TaxID=31234 RepID=E3LME6_CAERE|nr:hypothetical protein CRE_28119 [Caenorhabditis remanei]
MDYDPSQQYRERHNASWDRIRHENASSVRSEPADSSYLFNSFDYTFDNFQDIPQQAVDSYVSEEHQLLNLDYIPIDSSLIENDQNQSILDQNLQNQCLQPIQPLETMQYEAIEEIDTEEEDIDDDEDENSEDDDEEDDEIDRPDIYCMDCNSKIEDTTRHDVDACARATPLKFQCNMCKKDFNFEKNLKVHKAIEHSKSIDFVRGTSCPFCPKDSNQTKFSRFTAFVGHLKIHVKSDFLTCSQCLSEFENEKDRDRHIRRDHSEEVYELSFCPKCQKVIALEDSAAHCLLHISENIAKTRRKNATDVLIAIGKTSLSKLQSKSSTGSTVKSHKKKGPNRARKFQCEDCPKAFVRPSELARHSMIHIRAHAAKLPISEAAPPIPKWKCAICAKEYSHKTGLMEHNKTAHGKVKQTVCQICGLCFTKKSNLTRHMLTIHPLDQDSSDKNKFQCADCPTVFNTRASLTRHKRVCHNKASYIKPNKVVSIYERNFCKTCKREFRDEKMLEKHKRNHLLSEHRWRDLQGGGERKCDFCDKSYVLRASLVWHMQKHYEELTENEAETEQQPFCSLCDLNFINQQELRQHQDEQHSVICGVCHQKFSSRQVYEDHICNRKFARTTNTQILPPNRVLICRQCRPPQRLTTARQIREHRARHLPRKTHLCWTCHKSFRTAQLLSLHAEVHDRRPVQCSHCPQVFHSRVALKQHTRLTHGGDTNYQCVVHVDRSMAMSAQSFAEYGLAADHLNGQPHRAHSVTEWMDTVVPDEDCILQDEQDMRYQPTISNNENQFTSKINMNPTQIRVCGADNEPIRCEVCHHLYNNIEMLCDHWQGSDTDTDHSYRIVTCPICESRIRGASEAANHLRNAHLFARPRILQFIRPSTNNLVPIADSSDSLALAVIPTSSSVTVQPSRSKKGHQCMQCLKMFTRKNDLERHHKIHTGEKDYQCPECPQSFRMKSTLKNHMATHSDNPPQVQCTVCQKSFYEKKTLVVHMRIHTGEQPYKCRFCDLHFRTPAMQRTHEKKCAYGGPQHPILPDPCARTTSSFQPQFTAPQINVNRTITQISTLPQHDLQLSRFTAFNTVNSMSGMATSGDTSIFVITKPITPIQYVVIVQKMRPAEGTMRYAEHFLLFQVDTVSEIKIHQLQESTNLSIVLHNDMRLNLNTVKMLEMVPALRIDDVYKTRVAVVEDTQIMDENDLFSIIAHNKTSGMSSFIRRCEICEVDLHTKRQSDDHFYSEDHETAQLMYPSKNQQPAVSVDRNLGVPNMMAINNAETSEFNCKLCGSRFFDMNSLLNHIGREHDEPVIPPRPIAHTAPIN